MSVLAAKCGKLLDKIDARVEELRERGAGGTDHEELTPLMTMTWRGQSFVINMRATLLLLLAFIALASSITTEEREAKKKTIRMKSKHALRLKCSAAHLH